MGIIDLRAIAPFAPILFGLGETETVYPERSKQTIFCVKLWGRINLIGYLQQSKWTHQNLARLRLSPGIAGTAKCYETAT